MNDEILLKKETYDKLMLENAEYKAKYNNLTKSLEDLFTRSHMEITRIPPFMEEVLTLRMNMDDLHSSKDVENKLAGFFRHMVELRMKNGQPNGLKY